MSPPLVGALGFFGVLVFMLMGMPIGIAFLLVGFTGTVYLAGLDTALAAVARIPYTWSTEYIFTCIPLFVLMGFVCFDSGIATGFYRAAHKFLGRLPGGLALASIVGCGGFAAVSGSSTASAATMGAICIPEMDHYKYDSVLSSGTIAAGGTLGIMIPPSLGFILYGILAEESIGKLFMAGIIPGLILVLSFMTVVVIWVKLNPSVAPTAIEKPTFKEKLASLKGVWPILLIFLFVLGGIYTGAFTPVEAGGMGAISTVILAFAMRRMTLKKLLESCKSSISVTAMMFMLLMGAMIFNVFLAVSTLPQTLSAMMTSIGSPTLMVIIILLLYLPLGCFMDAAAMIILTIPLYLPALIDNNVNLIWFGVLTTLMGEMALITPPIGMNVYVVQGVIKTIPVEQIFKGIFPYLIAYLCVLVLLFFVPSLSLYLPSLMKF